MKSPEPLNAPKQLHDELFSPEDTRRYLMWALNWRGAALILLASPFGAMLAGNGNGASVGNLDAARIRLKLAAWRRPLCRHEKESQIGTFHIHFLPVGTEADAPTTLTGSALNSPQRRAKPAFVCCQLATFSRA